MLQMEFKFRNEEFSNESSELSFPPTEYITWF